MLDIKIIGKAIIKVAILSAVFTALIRSIALQDWLFVYLYVFLLIAMNFVGKVHKILQKKKDVDESLDKVNDVLERMKQHKKQSQDEENADGS